MTNDDLHQLADRIAKLAVQIDATTRELLIAIREFDLAGGWAKQSAQSCAHWLAWWLGLGPSTAREHVRVAHRLAELPLVDAALRDGSLSYCKVRAITRVATPVTEARLVELARLTTGAQLERTCRTFRVFAPQEPREELERRYIRQRDLDDGMVKLDVVLRPDEAALVLALLDKIVTRERDAASAEAPPSIPGNVKRLRPHAFGRADALMSIASALVRDESPERTPVELIVVVDRGTGSGKTAGGSIVAPAVVERLMCDAGVVDVVEDDHGNVIDVGRKHRTLSTKLKRALAARDPHCRFPGCSNRAFLDAHHVVPWSEDGETNLDNLVRTCTFHHDLLHDGYRCTFVGGAPVFADRDGRPISIVPERPRVTAIAREVDVRGDRGPRCRGSGRRRLARATQRRALR